MVKVERIRLMLNRNGLISQTFFFSPPIKPNSSWTCRHSYVRTCTQQTQSLDGSMHAWVSSFNPVIFFFFFFLVNVRQRLTWLQNDCLTPAADVVIYFTPLHKPWRLSRSRKPVFSVYKKIGGGHRQTVPVSPVFTDGQADQYNTIEFSNLWSL